MAWAVATTFFLGLALPASAHRVEKHFPMDVRPIVTVSNANGTIVVKSWQKAEVLVIGTHASDKVEVDTQQMGNRIEVTTHLLSENVHPGDLKANYEITVPEESELQIRTDSGLVTVERITGDMTFDTVAADLQLQEVAGYLVVKTIGGSFVCVRCAGRIEVNSISGNVRLEQTESSNVRAQTSSGNIYFDGDFRPGGLYSLKNYSGLLEVRFSENDSFDLSATSMYGKVENEATLKPLTHNSRPPASRFSKSLFGTYNTGQAKVELTSFSGTIKILKRQ